MNYFNSVFSTVQQKCQMAGTISDGSQLKDVAEKAGLPMERLYFYLNCLDEMEVIHFIPASKTVTLTDIGKEVTEVFPRLVF